MIPLLLNTPAFIAAWTMWQQHRKEIKKPLGPTAAGLQLKKLEAWGAERAVAAIEYSICNGYQGIFEARECQQFARSNGAETVILGKELERVIAQMQTIKSTYGEAQTWCADDIEKYKTLRRRRIELKTRLGVTA